MEDSGLDRGVCCGKLEGLEKKTDEGSLKI